MPDERALYGAPQHDADAADGYTDTVYDAHATDWTPTTQPDPTAEPDQPTETEAD